MRWRYFSVKVVIKRRASGALVPLFTNVYAHTRVECEKLLAEMIAEVKAKIAAEKAAMN